MENKYTAKRALLKYSMTLYTIALMCIFFVIVGANDAITNKSTTALASIDWLNLFGIMTASFFGLAMFENNGKLTGFWGLVSAAITVVVFYKIKVWTLFALYCYNVVTNLFLTFNGVNEEQTPDVKKSIIELTIVLIAGLILEYIFEWRVKGFSLSLIDVFSVLSFLLTGVGQTLLIKQTRWQFAAWFPKNGLELIVGIMTASPVVICRNIFFMGMNAFSLTNWLLADKEAEFEKENSKSEDENQDNEEKVEEVNINN